MVGLNTCGEAAVSQVSICTQGCRLRRCACDHALLRPQVLTEFMGVFEAEGGGVKGDGVVTQVCAEHARHALSHAG